MENVRLSVIIPFKNEEENLVKLNTELKKVLNQLSINCAALFVDDGSTDRSHQILEKEISANRGDSISYLLISWRKNLSKDMKYYHPCTQKFPSQESDG